MGKLVDLIELFVGLVAFLVVLACLGKMGELLSAQQSASAVTESLWTDQCYSSVNGTVALHHRVACSTVSESGLR